MAIDTELVQQAAQRVGANKVMSLLSDQETLALSTVINKLVDNILVPGFEVLHERGEIEESAIKASRIILPYCIAESLLQSCQKMIDEQILPDDPITADLLMRGLFPVSDHAVDGD